MATKITWSAKLQDAAGAAAAGANLAVEIFDLARKRWVAVSTARTAANGLAKGTGEIADDTLPFAPAVRLVEGQAVMSVTPAISSTTRGLTIDFGEVRRAATATPFILTGTGRIPGMVLGGGSATTADVTMRRADLQRDFSAQLQVKEREVAERDTRIADLSGKLTERIDLTARKDAEINRLTGVIATRESELAAALRARGSGSTTRVTDLASTIGGQLDDAQVALKSRGFSLGAIEVNAKALLQDEGRRIEFPDRETLKALPVGSLADVRMSFRPDAPLPDVPQQIVPDLMFLTQSRARAVLASLGLSLEASHGPAALNRDAAPGQAMLQTPGAGAPVPRGGRVHVVFAPETSDQQE